MVVFLLVFLAFIVNFAIYKSIDSLIDDFIPRWLKYVLVLVPPMALIFLVITCIFGLLLAVYETIKNI